VSVLFILLAQVPDKDAKIDELISPILSGMAFILSAAAFIFTVGIQLKERKRNIRQTLSTSLSEIARINVDISKLKKDEKESTPELLNIRKNYNSQRGTLASGADFLIKENEKLLTDADCELMAITFDDVGDIQKARQYWLKAIALAQNPAQKHLHQRDYAAFLYNSNQIEQGRQLFETSLQAGLSQTDDELRYLCDTFLMWAQLEYNFGSKAEFKRLINEAKVKCGMIKHKAKKGEMGKLIKDTLAGYVGESI
jgi:hypothetical protein